MNTPPNETSPNDCVFCRIARGELDPEVVAFRDVHTVVFPSLHQQPRNLGHTLVIPTRHIAQIYDLSDDVAGPLMATLARVAKAVKHACSADGITIRQNNERHGGQDVFHIHFHVIPRFADDGFIALAREFGAVEVPFRDRVKQASALRDVLG
jgi:histidine triad (HIT) family protein